MIIRVSGDGQAAVEALIESQPQRVTFFGADWCTDCRRVLAWLTKQNVPFTSIDTNVDESARATAALIAGERDKIPVLVAPHGTVLVRPSDLELAAALHSYRRRPGAASV